MPRWPAKSLKARFNEKVDRSGSCHLWKAHLCEGYGKIQINGSGHLAHRVAWELANGTIPKGSMVLHRCGNRLCVNIKHLYLGTFSDNVRDAIRHGTHWSPRGKAHHNFGKPLSEWLGVKQ